MQWKTKSNEKEAEKVGEREGRTAEILLKEKCDFQV